MRSAVISRSHRRRMPSEYRYTLRDEFCTPDAAPITAPRVCQPGPGTWAVVNDAESKSSISSNRWNFQPFAAPTNGYPGILGAPFTRYCGAAIFGIKAVSVDGSHQIGFDIADYTGSLDDARFFMAVLGAIPRGANQATRAYALNTEYECGVILRATGCFMLMRQVGEAYYTLEWVHNAGSGTPVAPAVVGGGATGYFRQVRFLDLRTIDSRFLTDNGLATLVLTSPAVSAVARHEANAWLDASGLVPTADATQLMYRWQDDTHCWRVDVSTDGNVYLQELNGATTQRGAAAHGLADGVAYRVMLLAEGNVHKVFINGTLQITYTDPSSLFVNATAVKIATIGTGDTLTQVATWPRRIYLPEDL